MQEQQHNGQCQTYIYDPDEAYCPLARIDHLAGDKRGDMLWFSTDLNGAPLEVTDGYGELRWSGRYGSFGEVARQTEGFHRFTQQTTLTHQPLRYAGQYADSETGLHYNLFRYYDPQIGRFTVQDPIGLLGGWNLYQYAPNPLGWIDPWGLANRPNNGEYHIFHNYSLDPQYRYSSNAVQFNRANIDLVQKMEANPEFRKDMLNRYPKLDDWLKNGDMGRSPPGLTWHHHEDINRLTLVDRADHRSNHALYHPTGKGGRDIWGGGKPGRQGKLDGSTGRKICS